MEQTACELPSLLEKQPCWHIGFNVTQAHIQETGFITECLSFKAAFPPDSISLTIELTEREGVSLDIENYCTLRLFFDLSTLAGLSRRNLPEAGIRLLFQI